MGSRHSRWKNKAVQAIADRAKEKKQKGQAEVNGAGGLPNQKEKQDGDRIRYAGKIYNATHAVSAERKRK